MIQVNIVLYYEEPIILYNIMKEPIHLFHSLFGYTLADNDMCRSVADLYKYRVHMESLHTRQSLELKKKTDCETWENMWNLYRYTCYSIEKSTTNLKYLNVFLSSFIRFELQQYYFLLNVYVYC